MMGNTDIPSSQIDNKKQEDFQINNETQQQQFQLQDQQSPQQNSRSFGGIIFFTFLFKFLPLCTYFYSTLKPMSEQYLFFLIGFYNGLDFWYTKNISGRFLAGLVWGSEVDQNGNDKWFFEKEPPKEGANPINKFMLWGSLGISSVCWGIYLIWAFINRNEMTVYICLIGAVLAYVNLFAFLYCELEIKKKIIPLIEEQFFLIYEKMIKKLINTLKESTKDIKIGNIDKQGGNTAILENLPNYQEIMKLMGKDNLGQSSE